MTNSTSLTSSKPTSRADRYAAGWRPLVGYVCAIALAGKFVMHPILIWSAFFLRPEIAPPVIGSDGLLELIIGMLGLAGLRTYEKKIKKA